MLYFYNVYIIDKTFLECYVPNNGIKLNDHVHQLLTDYKVIRLNYNTRPSNAIISYYDESSCVYRPIIPYNTPLWFTM